MLLFLFIIIFYAFNITDTFVHISFACGITYSHSQVCVVEQILHGVFAGELIQDLGPVGDRARSGVYRSNSARDVDELDIWKVRKLPSPNLSGYLLTEKSFLAWQRTINVF